MSNNKMMNAISFRIFFYYIYIYIFGFDIVLGRKIAHLKGKFITSLSEILSRSHLL